MKDLKVDKRWSLQDWQLANHFPEKKALTTKAGLTEILAPDAGVRFQADADPASFFPLSFDLNSRESLQHFLEEIGVGAARRVLRMGLDAKRPVNRAIWSAALSVSRRFASDLDIDEQLDTPLEPECKCRGPLDGGISDVEWQLIHLAEQCVEQDARVGAGDDDDDDESHADVQLFSTLDLRAAPRVPFPRLAVPTVRADQSYSRSCLNVLFKSHPICPCDSEIEQQLTTASLAWAAALQTKSGSGIPIVAKTESEVVSGHMEGSLSAREATRIRDSAEAERKRGTAERARQVSWDEAVDSGLVLSSLDATQAA